MAGETERTIGRRQVVVVSVCALLSGAEGYACGKLDRSNIWNPGFREDAQLIAHLLVSAICLSLLIHAFPGDSSRRKDAGEGKTPSKGRIS